MEALADIVSSLQIDKFDEIYHITKEVLNPEEVLKEECEETSEEIEEKRKNSLKLKEVAYETLGKAWPENSKKTQEQYRLLFLEHCSTCLPNLTRNIQVSVLIALGYFVDKLYLLKEGELTKEEDEALDKTVFLILQALEYSLGIGKHLRLRKESLNIVLSLVKKLQGEYCYIDGEITC